MFFLLLLFPNLLLIFWQDFKMRHIHVVLPFFIFISSLYFIKPDFKIISLNLIFIIVLFSTLTIYLSYKNKKIINPFKLHFGLGDLLFYLAIIPFFNLYNFILFFVLSMLFAILCQKIFFKLILPTSIPLAGLSSILLLLIILKDVFLSFESLTLIKL